MITLFAITIAAVIAVLLLRAVAMKLRRVFEHDDWPFYSRKPLSVPEQVLYFRLLKALPEYIILAQVALSRLLGVKKGNNHQAWLNRINRMSADFVVCAKDSRILAVIELDDTSHERNYRRAADAKKDRALTSAGIRLIRWNVKSLPDETTIRGTILQSSAAAQSMLPDDQSVHPVSQTEREAPMPIFRLTLQPTYYNQGFFNVVVDYDRYVRKQDGPIRLRLGHEGTEIEGKINRKVNNNGTARFMGGAPLRDWFQKNFEPMDVVPVDLGSQNVITLREKDC